MDLNQNIPPLPNAPGQSANDPPATHPTPHIFCSGCPDSGTLGHLILNPPMHDQQARRVWDMSVGICASVDQSLAFHIIRLSSIKDGFGNFEELKKHPYFHDLTAKTLHWFLH